MARTRRAALLTGAGGALGLLATTPPGARGALCLVEGGLHQELVTAVVLRTGGPPLAPRPSMFGPL